MAVSMNWIQLRSFRARVFWSLVPVFFVLFLFIGFVDFYQQNRLAKEEIRERAKSMAENLAHSVRLAVLTEDKWLLESALQSVTGAADFAYVWIYGEKWTSLAKARGQNTDSKDLNFNLTKEQQREIINEGKGLTRVAQGERPYVEYIAPVTSTQISIPYELQLGAADPSSSATKKHLQTIGAVHVALSLARVDAQMSSFLEWRGWSLAVFLCLSTIAIYIFSDRITRPINRLTEHAKRMSRGYLNEAIPAESRDEIGQLATACNDMARALSEQYLGLEQKVAERTNELRSVNLKLARASEHKSRFLANVNHELRTPLSSVIGYARLLRRDLEAGLTSLQRENLDDLLVNAERLLAMIDSLLDFAKIEAGRLDVHIEPVAVDELIRTAVATVEPMLHGKSIRLAWDLPQNVAPVETDSGKLRQIMLNLLENAIKFTDSGEIRISACQDSGNVKLIVADTGIGIDKADLERIFEEFDRGRLNGSYRGTGLGLAIVKRLVEALEGSIAVESEAGSGSIFTITLPVNKASSLSV